MARLAAAVAILVLMSAFPIVTADTPAELAIVAPAYAAAGERVDITGSVTIMGAPVPRARLELLLNGVVVDTVNTGLTGLWFGSVLVPGAPGANMLQTVWNRGTALEERSPLYALVGVLPPGAPAAPTLQRDGAAVMLSWSAPANDGGGPITSHEVERRIDAGAWKSIASVGQTSYRDANATPGAFVLYRVRAANAAGAGAASPEADIVTLAGSPRSVAASFNATTGLATIGWQPPAGGSVPVTGYTVWRDNASIAMLPASASSHQDPGLPPLSRVEYRVSASNAAGEGVRSGAVVVRTPPAAVVGFQGAAAPGSDDIELTWAAADPNASAPITGYRVQRWTGSGWTLIGQPNGTATRWLDTDRDWGATFRYRIFAENAAGAGPEAITEATVGPEAVDIGLEITVAYVCPAPAGRPVDPQGCAHTATGFIWDVPPGPITMTARSNGDVFYVESGPARWTAIDAWTTTVVHRSCDDSGDPGCTEDLLYRSDANTTQYASDTGQLLFWAQWDEWTIPAGECHDVHHRVVGTHPYAIEDEIYVALTRFCA